MKSLFSIYHGKNLRFFLAITLLLSFATAGLGQIKVLGKPAPFLPLSGLVAFWPANGNAMDFMGRHDGTLLNNAAFSKGVEGLAFNFDNSAGIQNGWGSNIFPPPAFDGGEYVSVPNSRAWSFGNKNFTIEVWAKFNDLPVYDIGHSQGGIFISHDEGPYEVNKWWFALGGGVLNMHINDPLLGPVWLVQAPFTPVTNQWYHFAITRNKDVFTIYVNGEAVGSDTSTRALPQANAPLNIGEAEGFYFNGQLDDIAIFNRALSPSEIKRTAKFRPRD